MAPLEPKPTNDMDVNRVEEVDHVDNLEEEKERSKHDSDASSINDAARGDDLPPGYFYSLPFIGTMAVSPYRHFPYNLH